MKQLTQEWLQDEYTISTDSGKLNIQFIYEFLSQSSYWAQNRTFSSVSRSIENSLNFGLYRRDQQIGFARVVTDHATFAWLADVFIIEEYRGRGLGKWLIRTIVDHPDLQLLRRWVLATRDAHELYLQVGFVKLRQPNIWMERTDLS